MHRQGNLYAKTANLRLLSSFVLVSNALRIVLSTGNSSCSEDGSSNNCSCSGSSCGSSCQSHDGPKADGAAGGSGSSGSGTKSHKDAKDSDDDSEEEMEVRRKSQWGSKLG